MKLIGKTRFNYVHENMIRAVVQFSLSATWLSVTQSVALLYTLVTTVLQVNLAMLAALRASIALPITGYAAQNMALKKAIAEISAAIMRAVYAYAVNTNNTTLANQMNISASKLKKMGYTAFIAYVQHAINVITPLIGSLSSVGVTSAAVTTWQNLLTQLAGSLSDPRNAITNRKAVNEAIQNVLRATMLCLYNECDHLVYQFKSQNLDYYNNYRAARKLVPHELHTQLRAHVQTEVDQPVNAEVVIDGTGISEFTDPNTGYCLIHVPFGWHTVTVITGMNSKTFGPYDFKKGHSLTQHFVVAPAFAEPAKTTTEKTEAVSK